MRKNAKNETNIPLTISSKDGLINQNDFFNKQVASKDMSGYYLLHRGEYAYNKSYSVGYDFGSIKRLEKYNMGALSTLYICFALTQFDSDFIKHYFDSLKWYKEIYMISAEGARNHGLLNVPTDDFFATLHTLPSNLAEQRKIATFLDALTRRIEKQRSLVENLKKYKRGLLQQIFSRKISICETNASWDFIPLGEIGSFFGGLTGKSKEDFEQGQAKFITYMNVYKNTFADETMLTSVNVLPHERQNIVRFGDVLFTQSSETLEEVGLTSVWVHQSTPYLNSFCMGLRPHSLKKYNPYYLGYAMRSPQIRQAIMKEGQGISRINLAASRIEGVLIPIPPIETQIKIAEYLQRWDSVISANDNILSNLILQKKAFLQSLFI